MKRLKDSKDSSAKKGTKTGDNGKDTANERRVKAGRMRGQLVVDGDKEMRETRHGKNYPSAQVNKPAQSSGGAQAVLLLASPEKSW